MNKKIIDIFEKELGTQDSAWHDYNLEVATETLRQFSPNDWDSLEVIIFSKPSYWQERCAESAGGVENDRSVRLLTYLLESPNLLVASIAASELDNMSVHLSLTFESTLRNLLNYLSETKSPRSADVQRLLGNLT